MRKAGGIFLRRVGKIRKVIKKNNLFASKKYAKWSHACECKKSIEKDATRAPKSSPKAQLGSPTVKKKPSQRGLGAQSGSKMNGKVKNTVMGKSECLSIRKSSRGLDRGTRKCYQ